MIIVGPFQLSYSIKELQNLKHSSDSFDHGLANIRRPLESCPIPFMKVVYRRHLLQTCQGKGNLEGIFTSNEVIKDINTAVWES